MDTEHADAAQACTCVFVCARVYDSDCSMYMWLTTRPWQPCLPQCYPAAAALALCTTPHAPRPMHHAPCTTRRFRADTLLGVASVPLTPLLHDQWVDGVAPVYALLATLAPDGTMQHEEKIQVCRLGRACMSMCMRA